jgi:hypothetical protein
MTKTAKKKRQLSPEEKKALAAADAAALAELRPELEALAPETVKRPLSDVTLQTRRVGRLLAEARAAGGELSPALLRIEKLAAALRAAHLRHAMKAPPKALDAKLGAYTDGRLVHIETSFLRMVLEGLVAPAEVPRAATASHLDRCLQGQASVELLRAREQPVVGLALDAHDAT